MRAARQQGRESVKLARKIEEDLEMAHKKAKKENERGSKIPAPAHSSSDHLLKRVTAQTTLRT